MMTPRLLRSKAEVLAAIRARRDELDITHACIEGLIGLPDRYLSKVISAKPIKTLSPRMLRDLLDGLALGIVAIVLDENPEQAERMQHRWAKRKRPPTTKPSNGASLCIAKQRTFDFDDERNNNAESSR